MPSMPLKHKYLSIILIWVIVVEGVFKEKLKKKIFFFFFFFFLLFLIGKTRHGIGKKVTIFD